MLDRMRVVVVVASASAMIVALGGCSTSPQGPTTTTAVTTTTPVTTTSSVTTTTSVDDEYQAAQRAAREWIARNPNGWVLTLDRDKPLVRPEWSKPCSENPDSKSVTVRYGDGGPAAGGATEVDLGFECPVGTGAGVGDLTRAFADAVLPHLPHGITAPGWTFDILTPISSINQGVAFSQPAAGRVLITIDTPMFAVYGHSTRAECQPPADAPSPAGCSLQLEHRIPLRLALTAPFTGAEFS